MEEQRIWVKIILLIILLFLSAFFSAAEAALISLKRIHIGDIKEKNSKEGTLLKLWLKNPNELLTTLLLGKTAVYVLSVSTAVMLAESYYNSFFGHMNRSFYMFSAFVIIVIIMLIITEITPRVFAKNSAAKISRTLIVPLNTLRIILRPVILIFLEISKLIIKLFGIKVKEQMFEITEEDIKTFVKEGTEVGVIEEGEEEMIHSIFEFSDTTVKEILTPRTTVFALDMEKTIGEVWDEVVEQGFSRIPVYNETIDKIVGIVHMKDMIKYNKEEHSDMKIKELMKEPYFVPTTKTLVELLEEFKKKQSHMAIIIDEYGGTLGIVTIEDLLEEIVGEIRDEFDQEEESIQQIKETIFDIRGDTVIEELNEELDINMPVSEEYDTVSGYVQDELGKVAEEGDQVKGDGFILKVMEVDNKRIEKLRIIITEKNSEGETDDGKD